MSKIAPALAAGNTLVLKPSEFSPYSAHVIAQVLHDAGVPKGVFNMIFGDGGTVGVAMSEHSDIDMISFTGSTRAGIDIARRGAESVKIVHQELGGKSPNILLPSADFPGVVERGIQGLMYNSGQNCSAPSRMLVPNARLAEVKEAAAKAIAKILPGVPTDEAAFLGPVVNQRQYEQIQKLIQKGIDEGATVVAGGLGRPEGLKKGYFVRPTVFADTTPDMTVVKEEIFGPVLVIQGYDSVEEGIALAKDTEYGLAAYIQGADLDEVRAIADRIPAGQIYLNNSGEYVDFAAPFGGFKKSGNGREWGAYGIEAFLQPKALVGYTPE